MNAFRESEVFCGAVLPGKRALKAEHRRLLLESGGARVTASINFESAVENIRLTAKRWDYFIEVAHQEAKSHGVEVHGFRPAELKGKKDGTLELLRRACPGAISQVTSWNVLIRGDLPRQDLIARFSAETRIRVARQLRLSQLP